MTKLCSSVRQASDSHVSSLNSPTIFLNFRIIEYFSKNNLCSFSVILWIIK